MRSYLYLNSEAFVLVAMSSLNSSIAPLRVMKVLGRHNSCASRLVDGFDRADSIYELYLG